MFFASDVMENSLAGLQEDVPLQVSISKVQIPVGVFDIVNQISNRDFKIKLAHVRIDSGKHDAIEIFRRSVGAGDAVKGNTAAL